ncbi:MAG: hypothetical protein ACYCYK_09965 [Candidatus Dormibacteria bacterium]
MDPRQGGASPDPADLTGLDDRQLEQLAAELEAADRALRIEMAPLQARLAELSGRQGVLATELRRRERQRHLAQRRRVRAEVEEGQAPSLLRLVEAEDPPDFGELPFSQLEVMLETGGVVALGYPGSRAPSLQMTDGSEVAAVADLGEARRLFQQGWDFGVPARKGVRVHTPGTRLERLLDPDRCFIRPRGDGAPEVGSSPSGA